MIPWLHPQGIIPDDEPAQHYGDGDRANRGGSVAKHYIYGTCYIGGVSIPIVQPCIVGLIEPLPEEGVEGSGGCHGQSDGQRHLQEDERAHPLKPGYQVACVRVYRSPRNYLGTTDYLQLLIGKSEVIPLISGYAFTCPHVIEVLFVLEDALI